MRLLLARGKINEIVALSQRSWRNRKGTKETKQAHMGDWQRRWKKPVAMKKPIVPLDSILSSRRVSKIRRESGPPYLPSEQKGDLFIKGSVSGGNEILR